MALKMTEDDRTPELSRYSSARNPVGQSQPLQRQLGISRRSSAGNPVGLSQTTTKTTIMSIKFITCLLNAVRGTGVA